MALIVDHECPTHGKVPVSFEKRYSCPMCIEASEKERLSAAYKRGMNFSSEEIMRAEIDVLREMFVEGTSQQANYWEKVATKLETSRERIAQLFGVKPSTKP